MRLIDADKMRMSIIDKTRLNSGIVNALTDWIDQQPTVKIEKKETDDTTLKSTISWNKDIKNAPSQEDLLIIYKNDTGDNTYYETKVAWKLFEQNIWISDNDTVYAPNIICWARFPEYEKISNYN